MDLSNEKLLGQNSYPVVVQEIIEKIQKSKALTLTGNEFLEDIYSKLNESITPMLELKEFNTKAQQIASDDKTIKEILDFVTKRSTTGDLNFIINLCKEEHFANLIRTGHPNPKDTIKEIEKLFGKPSSVIEQGIRNGLFDTLKSNLLGEVKKALNSVEKPKDTKLNESVTIGVGNILKYNPVGIKFEDIQNNKTVFLTESQALLFDRQTKLFECVTEQYSNHIPENFNSLAKALLSANYNPETNNFSLNEQWDFDLQLNAKGEATINGKPIVKDDIVAILTESIQHYEAMPGIVQNFNKKSYCKDADNFILLVENAKNLILFDNLTVIKNLSESTKVIFDNDRVHNEPTILYSNTESNKLFESYSEFVEHTNILLKTNIKALFENQLQKEEQLISERNINIVKLVENQKELNKKITEVDNLLSLAESNSPAFDTLTGQKDILLKSLNENISELNLVKNNFKLF